MAYNLIVTEHADELLDHLIYHLLYRLKNPQAAKHLLDGIEDVYNGHISSVRKISNEALIARAAAIKSAAFIFLYFIYHF